MGPRCHRDLVLSGGWPAWWGCGPPAQPSALALQQPVHGGDTDGSCRTTVGRHGPHPRGVSGYPPAAENAVTAVLAGRFLRPRPFRGLRGRMRTVFGCSPTSPIGLLASMAAPDAQARGAWRRRSLAGIQPQRWSQAGELALGATGLSAAYCCRRPPVVFHSCCRDPQ